jgi:hypothetical protein
LTNVLAFYVAAYGIHTFPIGLPALFIWNARVLGENANQYVTFGYTVYAVLIIWGLIRPQRMVLLILCLLLLANIVGCQLEHTVKAVDIVIDKYYWY